MLAEQGVRQRARGKWRGGAGPAQSRMIEKRAWKGETGRGYGPRQAHKEADKVMKAGRQNSGAVTPYRCKWDEAGPVVDHSNVLELRLAVVSLKVYVGCMQAHGPTWRGCGRRRQRAAEGTAAATGPACAAGNHSSALVAS